MVELYYYLVITMAILAVVVFLALYVVNAGYGMLRTNKWGPSINNKLGWVLMEAPVFIGMLILWWNSDRKMEIVPLVFFLLFQLHYFHRSFVFPFMVKSKGKMPVAIVLLAVFFNVINAILQGGWIFYFSPDDYYGEGWFTSLPFIIGTVLFFAGMVINIHSDQVIRNLRKPGDTNHYMPIKGMFRYVSSANYFGEFIEWTGFAILTWSIPGGIFALWTFANLAPRAHAINKRYKKKFPVLFNRTKPKRILPYIY